MTSILSCLVAAVALSGEPGLQGLPFGIPPAADDAVITSVAPPQCLFYVNWAGTAAPDPTSKCETEKLLAEPEVQAFLKGIGKATGDYLRQQDKVKKDKKTAQILPSPWYLSDDVQYFPPGPQFPLSGEASKPAKPGAHSEQVAAAKPLKSAPANAVTTVGVKPGATNSNQEAASRIAQYLRDSGKLDGRRIAIRYLNGTVWLQGDVASKSQSDALVALVLATPGVSVSRVIPDALTIERQAEQRTANDLFAHNADETTAANGHVLIVERAVGSRGGSASDQKPEPNPPAPPPAPSPVLPRNEIAPVPVSGDDKPKIDVSYEDMGECLRLLLMRPTCIFITDVKVAPPKPAEKKTDTTTAADGLSQVCEQTPSSPVESIEGGMIMSLGPDAARLHTMFIRLMKKSQRLDTDHQLRRVKIEGKIWYRITAHKPNDKIVITFGFHEKYFVAGWGEGAVEGMLSRWNRPAPKWLKNALAQTEVPKRTGLIYLNWKLLRDKILQVAPNKEQDVAAMELLGLNNVDSLVSTTGLEESGMISRTLLAIDGKPRGLLDLVADRPLAAKDLQPIPSNALVAVAARFDLDRTFNIVAGACEKMQAALDPDAKKTIKQIKDEMLDKLKHEYGIDLHRFLSSIGDTWCVYNSPTEGEIAFLGWTAVVSVRDRAALTEGWEKLCAGSAKASTKEKADVAPQLPDIGNLKFDNPEFCKCRFAGHEIYYVVGLPIAPAFCISERDMVMTLNMPAMKAYLLRKNHQSLAALPTVAGTLKDRNPPASLCYTDAFKLFDFWYPLISFYGTAGAALAHQAKIDLDPTYWPSAPSIRAHLQPDVTTIERTPHGLQLTSRYSLPTEGASGLFWLAGLSGLANGSGSSLPGSLSDLFPSEGDGSCELALVEPASVREPAIPAELQAMAAQQSAPPSDDARKGAEVPLYRRLQTIRDEPTFGPSPATDARLGHKESPKPAASAESSQIYFVGPKGLNVQWDVAAPGRFDSEKLVAPARRKFPQGAVYRLKLTNIPGRPGIDLFPTIEVGTALPRTEAFLAHNAIPVEFTDEDFDRVMGGNFVTKVVYLPDPEFQEPGLAGVGTLVSTRLDPGVDPVVEADRRGAIVAIVRLGGKEQHSAAAVDEKATATNMNQ